MTYALSTIRRNGRAEPMLQANGRWWPLSEVAPQFAAGHGAGAIFELIQDWDRNQLQLEALVTQLTDSSPSVSEIDNDDFLAPIKFPRKAFFIGFNYYDHIEKDAKIVGFKKEEKDPFFFLKPPSTTLVGLGPTVPFPQGTEKFDWEVELVAVIGRGGRHIAPERALEHVAGYMVGLDLSARDWQMNPRHPIKFDIFTGKAFDASSPVGPKFVPAKFVDPRDLRMRLWVNNVLYQDSSTREMIWSLDEQIALLSQHITLEPGDLIFTGTPAGVGYPIDTYLHPGDCIDAEIDGLGRMRVRIGPSVSAPD